MTEKECLDKMFLIWGYLYRNPYKTKKEVYEDLQLSEDLNDCPCCEYVVQQEEGLLGDDLNCGLCPLSDLWPDSCHVIGTAFSAWHCAKTKPQKQAACKEIFAATVLRLRTLGETKMTEKHKFILEIAAFIEELTSETIVRWKCTSRDMDPKFYAGNDPNLLWHLSKITAKRLVSASKETLSINWIPYGTSGLYTIITDTRHKQPLKMARESQEKFYKAYPAVAAACGKQIPKPAAKEASIG